MDTNKHELKTTALSAFIRVNLRPKMFFSQLLTLTLGA